MAGGHADDLAGAVLLATDKPILIAPAMNPRMWAAKATQRNLAQLAADGVRVVGPNTRRNGGARRSRPRPHGRAAGNRRRRRGDAAPRPGRSSGKRVLVTSGPTHEPIDPVRFIANRSSGKQGHAIAAAAAAAGADVVLVSGPVDLPDPPGVDRGEGRDRAADARGGRAGAAGRCRDLRRRGRRLARRAAERNKIKKQERRPQTLALVENPDILSTVAHRKSGRPRLVIGFAAETDDVIANAKAKLAKKGCDWILANDVSPETGIMGGDANTIHLVTAAGVESWPPQSKDEVARSLVARIAAALKEAKQ